MNISIDYKKIKQIIVNAWEKANLEADNIKVFTKGTANFVTQTDIKIQRYIKEHLQEIYPQIGFMGEEENTNIMINDMQWILDPIDGTTNYIYHYNHSAISLALKNKTEIIFGVIYNPFTKEMFCAIQGKGAFLNNLPIYVNNTESLASALVAVGTSPYYKNIAPLIFSKIEHIYNKSLDIRRTGSAALDLAYVACGRQDAYFEYQLKPWDYAAGNIIVKEAGGIVKSINENIISYEKTSDIIACTNEKLMSKIKEILN